MLMDLISYNIVENVTKMADQVPRHQVLSLAKGLFPPSTAVSHNGVLNSLSGSRLTWLLW
jgi:hypothetical protein